MVMPLAGERDKWGRGSSSSLWGGNSGLLDAGVHAITADQPNDVREVAGKNHAVSAERFRGLHSYGSRQHIQHAHRQTGQPHGVVHQLGAPSAHREVPLSRTPEARLDAMVTRGVICRAGTRLGGHAAAYLAGCGKEAVRGTRRTVKPGKGASRKFESRKVSYW